MTMAERAGRFWMMDKPTPPASAHASPAARFGRIGPDAAEGIAAGFGAAAAAAYRVRLAAGRKAYAIWKDGAPAAVGWVSFTPERIGELGLWVHLRPGEAYVWDCVTQPAFRRQGLYRTLLAYMAETLLSQMTKVPMPFAARPPEPGGRPSNWPGPKRGRARSRQSIHR